MATLELDTVRAEKAHALRRYNRRRIFSSCLCLSGAVFFLICLLSFSTKMTLLRSNNFSASNDQFYAFVLINFIVLTIYQLSATTNHHKDHQNAAAPPRDIYEEYVSLSATSSSRPCRRPTTSDEEANNQLAVVSPAAPEADASDSKLLVACKNVYGDHGDGVLVKENPVRDLTVTESRYDKSYRRTRSEKLELAVREEEKTSRRRDVVWRRSVKERWRTGVAGSEAAAAAAGEYSPGRKSVEEMDGEEFRRMIESYIESTNKIWRDENIALLDQEQRQRKYMAITF